MNEDIVSKNFTINADRAMIRRIINLLKVLLVLVGVYTLFDILEWYMFIAGPDPLHPTKLTFYLHNIRPVIAMTILLLNIVAWNYLFKAHRYILSTFEKEDVADFNTGYSFFYKAIITNLVAYVISIISIVIRLVLKN